MDKQAETERHGGGEGGCRVYTHTHVCNDYAYARNSRPVTRHRVILRSFDEVIWRGEEIFLRANICVVVLECLAYCRICV
jgi:hypothetical protein